MKDVRLDPSFLVIASFLLLQIFKLITLLITNKTAENILIIPFQLLIFLLPVVVYLNCKNRKGMKDPLNGLRLRMPRLYQLPLLISSLFLLICGNILVSLVFAGTGSLENGFTLYNTFVSRNNGGFFVSLYLIVAYAAVPAFCEELVFRALLCREYERHNVLVGILVSSVFFAMLHFDLFLFPVYFFSGLLLALTMYATGSAVSSMAVHLAFNVFGLFGQPYLNAFYSITGGTGGLFEFILCMMTLLAAAIFCGCASKCYAKRAKNSNMPARKLLPPSDKIIGIVSEILITPFSLASFFLYIVVVIIGFLI